MGGNVGQRHPLPRRALGRKCVALALQSLALTLTGTPVALGMKGCPRSVDAFQVRAEHEDLAGRGGVMGGRASVEPYRPMRCWMALRIRPQVRFQPRTPRPLVQWPLEPKRTRPSS